MKTLKTIQVLFKISRIVSKIAFICCIVGFCLCAAGILGLAMGGEALMLGNVTIRGMIEKTDGLALPTVYAGLAMGMVVCLSQGVLSKLAEGCFKRELADGDPFTLRGAQELMRLGLLTIIVPLAAGIICSIGTAVVDHFYHGFKGSLSIEGSTSIVPGILLIVLSLFCRYGAEVKQETPEA